MINKKKNKSIDKPTLVKSMKQIKELEKMVNNDQKKFNYTYCEYKKFKYSIGNKNKSTTLQF